MPTARWDVGQIELAKEILGRHTRVDNAAREIAKSLGRAVTPSSLKHALLSRGERPPSEYLAADPVIPPEERGLDLRAVADGIEEASVALEKGVHALTASQVASVTNVTQADLNLYGGLRKVVDDAFGSGIKPNLAEREGLLARTAYTRRLERALGQRDYLGSVVEKALVEAFTAAPIRLSTERYIPPRAPGRRMLVAHLSDSHFGLVVDPKEVPGNSFNWTIAARRMALYATQIASWKPDHRGETDLQVVINGDIIAGIIHLDDKGVALLTEQIHGTASILVGFFDYLRQFFGRIRVTCGPGNHDRMTKERQVAQRWDSHASQIYLALKMAFRGDAGIDFDIPRTGEGVFELPGGDALGMASHGDVKPTISNVGKSLNIKPMVDMIYRINASGEFDRPVRVLLLGHWHVPFVMPTGIASIVVGGSVIGPDSFARYGCGVRGNDGTPMQVMFESTPGFPLGDIRFVHLKPADDDEALDTVIPTPSLDLL